MRTAALVCAVFAVLAASNPVDQPAFGPSLSISPSEAIVFSGASLTLHATLRGVSDTQAVRWTVSGPGAIDSSGADAVFHATGRPGSEAIVAAASGAAASAVTVRTTAPPPAREALLVVTCYDQGELDVRSLGDLRRLGELSIGDQAGGIAVDAARRLAIVTAHDRLVAVDLRSMSATATLAIAQGLLSDVAWLRGDYVVVTNSNAQPREPDVLFYRLDAHGHLAGAGGFIVGGTPEDVVADRDGSEFYVSSTNSNLVRRFAFDGRGVVRQLGTASTATRPFGIAIAQRRHLLLVADNDTPYLSGARSKPGLEAFSIPSLRKQFASINTGTANSLPLGVVTDDRHDYAFVTNEGDGTVAAVRMSDFSIVATSATGLTPWMPAIDRSRHVVYVPNARSNTVSVLDATRPAGVRRTFSTCGYPTHVAVVNPT